MESKAGIYKIINKVNNKIYIGSSVNVLNRKYVHSSTLANNKHRNIHLQRAYNKYGKNNFVYDIIEYIENIKDKKELRKILINKEQYYINLLNPEYNINPIAGSRENYNHTQETKEKISKSNKGKRTGKQHTQETKEKMRLAKLGKQHTQETKEKISKYVPTQEQREKMRLAKLGKKLSKEHKKKISKGGKGRTAWNKGLKLKSQ